MSQHVNRVGLLRPVCGAPDEYFLIDSANPKVAGLDGAVRFVLHVVLKVSGGVMAIPL